MATLIDIPQNQPPVAMLRAENLMLAANQQLEARINAHRNMYSDFWDAYNATPDEIVAAMGTSATAFLAIAQESVEHIARLAAVVGKQLTDFFPAEDWQPRRELIPHEDGTVTIGPPAEGMDLHGKPIAT